MTYETIDYKNINSETINYETVKHDATSYAAISQQLLRRRSELLQRLHALNKDLHRSEGPLSADFAEQAVELENLDVLFELDEASRHELNQINNALERLQTEQYEFCAVCGESIGAARLAALPTADTCIGCAELLTQG
jgi:RNA polymerase-binding protein DksA